MLSKLGMRRGLGLAVGRDANALIRVHAAEAPPTLVSEHGQLAELPALAVADNTASDGQVVARVTDIAQAQEAGRRRLHGKPRPLPLATHAIHVAVALDAKVPACGRAS